MTATPDDEQTKDIDFLMSLGELFTLVVYGQLILEEARLEGLKPTSSTRFSTSWSAISPDSPSSSMASSLPRQTSGVLLKMIRRPPPTRDATETSDKSCSCAERCVRHE